MVISDTTLKHADLNLEINETWLAVVICVRCLETVATLTFKVLIFRLIYKKGPLIDSPINILILFDELGWFVQLIFQPQMFYILHVKNTEELHGQKGCLFLCIIYVLLVVFGGLAIACFRFIYIRAHCTGCYTSMGDGLLDSWVWYRRNSWCSCWLYCMFMTRTEFGIEFVESVWED